MCISNKYTKKPSNIFLFFYVLLFLSKIREELGMKPLPRDKFSSLSSPSPREHRPLLRKVPSHPFPVNLYCCVILLKNINVSIYLCYWLTNHPLFQSHTLDAILLLLRDLDEEELQVVHTALQNRLQTYTVDSETLNDSLHTEKSADIHWSIS